MDPGRRRFASGWTLALGLALAAQLACGRSERNQTSRAGEPAGHAAASTGAQRVTFAGCLDYGAIPGTFVLRVTGAEPGATGTGGSTSGSDAAEQAAVYSIVSADGRALDEYVGRPVRVSGHFRSNSGTGAGGTRESEPSTHMGTEDHGRLPGPVPRGTGGTDAADSERRVPPQVNADAIQVTAGECASSARR
jgi:hypothetical protein